MNYIRITKENIDKEHICCAMSGKQSLAKKDWLKHRFDEGLVFYRSEERGKCFIEYIPAENAWVPIKADGYIYINCLWVAGSMKGHGYSKDLLSECIKDAEAQGSKGLCILSAEGRKREFLADPKFLAYRGFSAADISDCNGSFPGGENKVYDAANNGVALAMDTAKFDSFAKADLCFTIQINARLHIIGYRGCVRPHRSITSRLRQFTLPTGKPRKAYPHRLRPTRCLRTANF